MNNEEYSKACTEVVTVLENIPEEYFEKIPYEKICFYRYKMDINYKYEYDYKYENLSEYAVAILMNLYRDHWVSEEKRKQIIAKENEERLSNEEIKQEKYSADKIFKNKYEQSENIFFEESNKNTEIVEYKEQKWYQKILNNIIRIFKRNNI